MDDTKKEGASFTNCVITSVFLALAVGTVIVGTVDQENKNNERNDLCEEFAAQNKEKLKDIANVNRHGEFVFTHPKGHGCKVYPPA